MIEFNLPFYKKLIKDLEHLYTILSFQQTVQTLKKDPSVQNICCLRHDIDYCLNSAYIMAETEHDLNITSTYHILMDSDHYNPNSQSAGKIIRAIAAQGHEIALHFDISAYDPSLVPAAVSRHKTTLEDIIGAPVESISYHNPGAVGLQNLNTEKDFQGLQNTYSREWNQSLFYISDSLCRFRYETPENELFGGKNKNLHLLIHPIWWVESAHDRDSKMEDNMNRSVKNRLKLYYDVLDKYGITR